MNISEKHKSDETTEPIELIINNYENGIGLFEKIENISEDRSCNRCGYTDCVCAPKIYGQHDLLKEGVSKQKE
ncbi:MAG: hypothetical protein A2306_01600 [Omnitrophica WOR_2 bacterium RIFOXYB2_FULL_38_16]|nr:MAG: hypothetical protein A2243_09355 [Omnitrophica WOR_2 bacterium RIFOXYA2_FULL_38_17]OGX58280.1 MAG: hypothetical protein A2447_02440 [Omnitrophica WOR_2 bacterium RIFOXYC2_FULL_38_12]OGX60066.1 MAG: hypothetical protein A2306_01600 [Omnitrophica WOR_2 bacterium RIFOXYB2_FULL_38_16]HBG60666.1 hypothetical protein [Candidatus Omnitrophota bacterium]